MSPFFLLGILKTKQNRKVIVNKEKKYHQQEMQSLTKIGFFFHITRATFCVSISENFTPNQNRTQENTSSFTHTYLTIRITNHVFTQPYNKYMYTFIYFCL
uniref:Uncharacterized protein n=1 Tax=Cacopsylla melanoneura TaxID=428564 RepID=A0A8D9F7T7_9HEMI